MVVKYFSRNCTNPDNSISTNMYLILLYKQYQRFINTQNTPQTHKIHVLKKKSCKQGAVNVKLYVKQNISTYRYKETYKHIKESMWLFVIEMKRSIDQIGSDELRDVGGQ